MIIETPIQDLSLDQVAVEAGISRGLLFHYFPTKTDFYLACIAAAGRRILRNTAPDVVRRLAPTQVQDDGRRRWSSRSTVAGRSTSRSCTAAGSPTRG